MSIITKVSIASREHEETTNIKQALARVKKNPRELYWRSRLVHASHNVGHEPVRKIVLESFHRVLAADPEVFITQGLPFTLLSKWSIAEAHAVTKALKWRDRAVRLKCTAVFWWAISQRCTDRLEALKQSRAALDAIPESKRDDEHAELLAELLINLDPPGFTAALPRLLSSAASHPVAGHTHIQWLARVKTWEDSTAFDFLVAEFSKLPEHARSPRDRVACASFVGARALERDDIALADASLDEMLRHATSAQFLGNEDTMLLPGALAKRKLLIPKVISYLEGVLKSDWRGWVRPGIESDLRDLRAVST